MIEFQSVSKTYPGGTVAVAEVSLVVPAGRTVALVGSSGSGKTTLLRIVNRMVDPTGGRVLLDGRDVRDCDPVALRRSIGYVPQHGGLLPHRTVVDNVAAVPALIAVIMLSCWRARCVHLLDVQPPRRAAAANRGLARRIEPA
jgi:osmoprotectant transport system ATP-binding protein